MTPSVKNGGPAMRNMPFVPDRNSCTSRPASSWARRTEAPCIASDAPSFVNDHGLAERSKMGASRRISRSDTSRERAGCDVPSTRAARVSPPSRRTTSIVAKMLGVQFHIGMI